jgi:peroxiredoxin Q/BCP
MLKVGQKAPLFVLKNQNDKDISLANLIGSKVLIWFFPRASTSGCTKEGIGLNDQINVFKKKNISIIGISKDSVKAQKNFCSKNSFKFDILSDVELKVLKAYKAWGLKKMYGKEYEGILRISYLVDEKGNIEKTFDKVKTATHATDVLESLNA